MRLENLKGHSGQPWLEKFPALENETVEDEDGAETVSSSDTMTMIHIEDVGEDSCHDDEESRMTLEIDEEAHQDGEVAQPTRNEVTPERPSPRRSDEGDESGPTQPHEHQALLHVNCCDETDRTDMFEEDRVSYIITLPLPRPLRRTLRRRRQPRRRGWAEESG